MPSWSWQRGKTGHQTCNPNVGAGYEEAGVWSLSRRQGEGLGGSLAWGLRGDEPEAGLLEELGCGAGGEGDRPAGPLRERPECRPATGLCAGTGGDGRARGVHACARVSAGELGRAWTGCVTPLLPSGSEVRLRGHGHVPTGSVPSF